MLPTGHIATALIVNRLVGLDASAAPAVLGALVQDAIDKTLAWVLNVVPVSRHIGHTPFAPLALLAAATAFFGRWKGLAFGVAAPAVTSLSKLQTLVGKQNEAQNGHDMVLGRLGTAASKPCMVVCSWPRCD